MTTCRSILLVEPDTRCGQALARLLRRNGHRVCLARTARSAVAAVARQTFDLAVVDLLVPGGGVDLGRRLSRQIPRLYLAIGAHLLPEEIIEAALGFPVLRKAAVPQVLGGKNGARPRFH
jgi:DNA-binding NtrC family response regulator